MDYDSLKKFFMSAGINLLFGIIILVAGLFFTNWFVKFLKKTKTISRFDPSLQAFLLNTIKLVFIVIIVLTAANVIGVPLTSVITIFASAGVAISLGMQGALGNLVGGVTLLILKPIKSGEFVKIGDHVGYVKAIGAFYTEIKTKDGTLINLPNSALTNTAIVNFTREGIRRVQTEFLVSYDSDMDLVISTLREMAEKSDLVHTDPPPKVVLDECTTSGMVFEVRAWADAQNYSKVRKYMTAAGKRALDAAGIRIPYQQLDVHIKQD
jgi:small conductance mechanosensitive channel